jgi:branched-chain amino acid transport system permease protein
MSDRLGDGDLTQPLKGAVEETVAEGATSPAVGRDEWVARHGEHLLRRGGRLGTLEERLRAAPWWAWLTLFACIIALLPLGFESGYIRRVSFDIVLYMLLALGLNVVVGWGGLLDLGYVAFYGVGAYAYAALASDQLGVHLPSYAAIPLVVLIGALAGLLVGLPSWRLVGDYLAIVTLFFFQAFIVFVTNSDNVSGHNVFGGASGISSADPLNAFGHELPVAHQGIFNVEYLYVALGIFLVVYVALHLLNDSRTGRAWRSLREDPLAANLMGMPVNWLKLMAFMFGAATAALAGSLFASLNGGVYPTSFAFPLLITVYTMVILGGAGRQAGVVIGAVLVAVMLEALREPGDARYVFYGLVLLGLVGALRLSWRLAGVLTGTVALGFVLHAVADAVDPAWVDGRAPGGASWLADLLRHWTIVPADVAEWLRPVTYVGLVASVLVLSLVRGWTRIVLLAPVLVLASFVWENVMLTDPASTRYVVLGAMLVGVMVIRPAGLLGERRVEIV